MATTELEDPNISEFSDMRNVDGSCTLLLPCSLNASVVETPSDKTAAETIIACLIFLKLSAGWGIKFLDLPNFENLLLTVTAQTFWLAIQLTHKQVPFCDCQRVGCRLIMPHIQQHLTTDIFPLTAEEHF